MDSVQFSLIPFYLYSSWQKSVSRFILRSLMSEREAEMTVTRKKNPPRRHEDETLRGSRCQRKPIVFWVTPNSGIRNHSSATDTSYSQTAQTDVCITPSTVWSLYSSPSRFLFLSLTPLCLIQHSLQE